MYFFFDVLFQKGWPLSALLALFSPIAAMCYRADDDEPTVVRNPFNFPLTV
jgi:hypothetical protein